VSRLPQTLVALALLAATASAFAVTEHLKLERSPITGTRVDKIFSPVCECPRDFAVVSFILRRPETVTLKIVDSDGETVRTLVRDRPEAKGRVSYTWDGRDDLDRVVPEGAYRPRAELRRNGRTIVMPNTMRVDTTAPVITLASVRPRVVSPDGDGTRDRVTARYRLDEQARPELLVNDTRQALGRFGKLKGRLYWFGKIDGKSVRPGVYEIRLRAVDRAGNRSARSRAVPVRVRYVELVRDRVEVAAGERFSVFVWTDADSYTWLFAGRRGKAERRVLRLRAPEAPGTYALYVKLGRWADRAEIVVTEPEAAP
jgi:hypothetical protein